MSDEFLERVHHALYHKSADPDHPDNRDNRAFLDGYGAGFAGGYSIEAEWECRARPTPERSPEGWPMFLEWKRGFNAGMLKRAWFVARQGK